MGFARAKQRIDTEKLLQWTFRDELPKRGRERSELICTLGQLIDFGPPVDCSFSIEPGFPAAMGETHPDALLIEAAVLSLEHASIDWPSTRVSAIGAVGGLLTDTDPALAKLTIGLPGLVAMHAKMGTRPQWDLWPAPEPVKNKNGKPLVHGLDGKPAKASGSASGVPWYPTGARSPLSWWPAPREAAFVRIEYSIWWQALDTLADHLANGLESYDPLPPAAHPSPWMLER